MNLEIEVETAMHFLLIVFCMMQGFFEHRKEMVLPRCNAPRRASVHVMDPDGYFLRLSQSIGTRPAVVG